MTQSFLRPERSLSYQSGYNKKEEKHEASRENHSPARSPIPSKASNTGRWVPPHSIQDVHDRNEIVFRRVRGILNKLTPEKFDRLLFDLLNLGVNSKPILKGIILLIFEKALEEPKYSSLYAQLCFRLSHEAPNFDDPANSSTTTFRRLLLSKCQDEFESRAKATAAFDKHEGPFTPELQEEKTMSKRKMLGNIKFIGELGKMGILHEAILHKCIQQLLAKKKKSNVLDMAEDIECLCQIMNTVGKRLDVAKAENIVNQYFARMGMLARSSELPSRIKFMLEDTIELRRCKWFSRRTVASEAGPRLVSQMRWEAYTVQGGHHPPFMHQNFGGAMPFGMPPPHGVRQDWLGDMFSGPLGRPMPPHMAGMFSQGPMNAGMVDRSLDKDSQKDIFGKDPVPKNQQIMKKLKDKTDLFEPHYLKNKQPATPHTLSAPAPVAAQQLAPKPMKSYASASLPSQPLNQPIPPKKFNLFDDESFDKMLKPAAPSIPMWNHDPFARTHVSTPPMNNTYIDSNYNQVSQQSNKSTNGQQEPNSFFPFPRHNSQKAGQINLRPTSSLTSTKKEEEVKPPEEAPMKGAATAVNLIIKDKSDKPKPKKNLLSKPEYERRVEIHLKQNITSNNIDNAVQSLKIITTTASYSKMLANKVIKDGVTKDTDCWNYFGQLLAACHKADLMPTYILLDALSSAADRVKTDVTESGLEYFASIGSTFVEQNVISLTDLADFFANGELYPGFIKCLQKLASDKGEQWLLTLIEDSKVDIRATLSADKQSDASLLEIAKNAEISFLFPVLCVQAQFTEVLDKVDNVNKLQSWIKENMKPALKDPKTFIQSMLFCILKNVTSVSSLAEGCDVNQNPDKESQEKEKEGLRKLGGLIKEHLDGKSKLQIDAVYSLQKFCYFANFPKGMLLRLFIAFYDLELIEEDAYMKWKEDINDTFPGKGKALFQVNTWLQWLETADEEDEEDD